MTMTYEEARAALAAKTLAEHEVARLGTCPPWRHAAFAAIEAALVISPAAGTTGQFATTAAALCAIALVVRADRRRLGVFINGYRRGRTRLVAFGLLVLLLPMFALSNWAALDLHRPALSVLAAAATFGFCYVGSVLWQRVFRRELGL